MEPLYFIWNWEEWWSFCIEELVLIIFGQKILVFDTFAKSKLIEIRENDKVVRSHDNIS